MLPDNPDRMLDELGFIACGSHAGGITLTLHGDGGQSVHLEIEISLLSPCAPRRSWAEIGIIPGLANQQTAPSLQHQQHHGNPTFNSQD